MSHRVDPADLATTAAPYGLAPFLLYAGSDGSARVNHVRAEIDTAEPVVARCVAFGRGVVSHVDAGGPLSLLWPATEPGGFSLIADGTGTVDGDELRITITDAVLHRPAPTEGTEASC